MDEKSFLVESFLDHGKDFAYKNLPSSRKNPYLQKTSLITKESLLEENVTDHRKIFACGNFS